MSVGAMYPGTFDPITNGHVDLVRRAAKLFDRVVVAVAASPNKAPMFTLEERIGMARTALGDVPNIVVDGYNGLTVDYVRQHGLKVIIRGLRAVVTQEQLLGMQEAVRHAHVSQPVKQYIAGQEEHHRKVGLQDELRALLKRHEIEWDEKYVWD